MQIQKVAKTVSLAIDEALKDLNTTIDKIEFEVLQEPTSGFFGIGRKQAKVLIKLIEPEKFEEEIKLEISREQAEIRENIKNIVKNEVVEVVEVVNEVISDKPIVLNNNVNNDVEDIKDDIVVANDIVNIASENIKEDIKEDVAVKTTPIVEEVEEVEDNTSDVSPVNKKPLNTEAPYIAMKFLTDVFDKMDLDISITTIIDEKNELFIDLKGENVGIAIGKRGQTLDSLQYLVTLVINKGDFAYMSVTMDTEKYRQRRKQTLETLALNLAKKAVKTGKNVNIEPMNPYERRIIHSKLQSDKTIKTYSVGDEPFRYVVIAPRNSNSKNKNKNSNKKNMNKTKKNNSSSSNSNNSNASASNSDNNNNSKNII